MFLEINLSNKKWLVCLSYNPKNILIETHLNNISKVLDANLAKYDQYLLIGDLNSETTEPIMGDFCDTSSLKNLVKEATCFKNPERPNANKFSSKFSKFNGSRDRSIRLSQNDCHCIKNVFSEN